MDQKLLEFRAGKMIATAKGNKKHTVEADPRKGKLSLCRSPDGTIHLFWKLIPGGTIEEDMLVFPDNQTFAKVDTGNDEDRVYLLQFKGSSRRFFFWMQEKNKDKDAENAQKLNDYMSNPPAGGEGNSLDGVSETDQNALMQLLSSIGGNGGAGGRPLQMGDLSNVLRGMNLPNQGGGADNSNSNNSNSNDGDDDDDEEKNESKNDEEKKDGGGITFEDLQRAMQGVAGSVSISPLLQDVFSCSNIQDYLDDESIQEELKDHLPEGRQTLEELYQVVSSPQIRQAYHALSQALMSDNFNTVMTNFGLDPMDGAEFLNRGDGIGAFLAALMKKEEEEDIYN